MAREYNIVSADSHLDILGSRWAPYVPGQYRDLIPKDPSGFVTGEGLKVAAYEGITARVYPDNVPDLTADFDNWPGTGSASQRLRELVLVLPQRHSDRPGLTTMSSSQSM